MIKKDVILLLYLLLFISSTYASVQRPNIKLSQEASISVLTCSPGNELYSFFGHSAIRVTDPVLDYDSVFNYGTCDFFNPNFYLNFVMGKLYCLLSVESYADFKFLYNIEERWVWEQQLIISHEEKQFLFDSLIINYKPDNRYYKYDFFFDNCATRIRNIIIGAIDREIVFDFDALEPEKSFRELLMPYLNEKPWVRLIINLAMGLPADKKANPLDYMFLPDHLMSLFETAEFQTEINTVDFTSGSNVILEGNELPKARFSYAPLWVFLMVLVITIIESHVNLQNKSFSWWYDRILFGLTGLLGILITLLWFRTYHQVTDWNLNLIWANPFHFLIIFFLSEKKHLNLLRYYFMINISLLVILIFIWPVLPQTLPWMIIPLVIAIMVRSVVILIMFRPYIVKDGTESNRII